MAGPAGPANVIAAGGELAAQRKRRIYADQDHRAGNGQRDRLGGMPG